MLHGVVCGGDVQISGAPPAGDRRVDVRTHLHPPRLRRPVPAGRPIAAVRWNGGGFTATERDGSVHVDFEDVGHFRILTGVTPVEIHAHPSPGAGEALAPLLVAGAVLAIALGVRSIPLLHASAVALGDVALITVGPSGVGKSTVAGLLSSAGALMIADDAVRVQHIDGKPVVHHGASHLRLRPAAAALAPQLDGATVDGGDERVTVAAPATDRLTVPLRAVVVPRWTEGLDVPVVTRLSPHEAFCRVVGAPRVAGWQVPGPLREHFDLAVTVTATVPAWELELPRTDFTDRTLGRRVRQALEDAGALAS